MPNNPYYDGFHFEQDEQNRQFAKVREALQFADSQNYRNLDDHEALAALAALEREHGELKAERDEAIADAKRTSIHARERIEGLKAELAAMKGVVDAVESALRNRDEPCVDNCGHGMCGVLRELRDAYNSRSAAEGEK